MHFNLICISELWSPRLLKILTPEGLNWLLGNVDLKRKLFTQGELSITPQDIIVAHLLNVNALILTNFNVAAGCSKTWICCKHRNSSKMLKKTWGMLDISFHCNFILSTAEKTDCCKKIEFAAGCSNPSGWYSSIKFGRIICLPKGVVHEKFHSNLVNTSWIKAICNKLSKCSILQQPPCFQHASPLSAWKER